MKFKVHLFREYRETYEVEAETADAALNLVRERILDCGSDQEVFGLMQELYEWRIMK